MRDLHNWHKKGFIYLGDLMDILKKHWWLIGAVGFLIACSANLQAMWQAPEQAKKANESVEKLSQNLEKYIAVQEEREKKQEYWLEKLTKKVLDE